MKQQKSWVSHIIVPCPGIDRCEHYKPGEANHPSQHKVSKVVYDDETSPQATWNKRIVRSGTFLNNLALVPFDPKLDPPVPGACFNCWRTNHFLRDCYLEKRYIFCRNCGRRSAEVQDCPRCMKAYCEYIEEEEHVRAKIELYGDESSPDYYERRKHVDLESKKSENRPQGLSGENKKDFWSGRSFDKDPKKSFAANTKPAGVVSYSGYSGKGSGFSNVDKFGKDFWSRGSFDKNSKTSSSADKKSASFVSLSGKGASLPKDKDEPKKDFDNGGSYENRYLCDRDKKEYERNVAGIVTDFKSIDLSVPGKDGKDTFSSNGHINLDMKRKDEQEKLSSNCDMDSSIKKKDEQETSFSSCQQDMEKKGEKDYKKCPEANLVTPAKVCTTQVDPTNCKSLEKTEDEQEAIDTTSLSNKLDDDDEDYDNMIVDEDERSVTLCDSDDAAQRFTDLLQFMKNLPVEAQDVAVRCFINAQKRKNQM